MTSTKDALPEKDGEYLVYCWPFGFAIYGYKVADGFGDSKVKYWSELPKAPMEVPLGIDR